MPTSSPPVGAADHLPRAGKAAASVLVVDAEPVYALGAAAALAGSGLAVASGSLVGLLTHEGPGGSSPGSREGLPGKARVVLLDEALADPLGVPDLLARVTGADPGAAVVLVVRRTRPDGVLSLVESGARGLVHRRCPPEELRAAVLAAAAGQTWIAAPLAARMRAEVAAEAAGERPAALSARERDVLRRLATGATNAEIGTSLGISAHTVRNHVHAILAKLGAANRTDAVAAGARRGLVEIPS